MSHNTNNWLDSLSKKAESCSIINPELYTRYDVKRGLRDISGRGVLAGLTEIGEVHSYEIEENEMVPCPGKLYYRGYDVEELVKGFLSDNRFGFEETCYLLLFGELPDKESLKSFETKFAELRKLPKDFTRDIIMKAPGKDMMNVLSRSVLSMYSYDHNPDDISVQNVLRQCLYLIACFPLLSVYAYQAFNHYHQNNSLYIHGPREDFSTAENILHLLRPDSNFTQLEAALLDLSLVLHAEHGGGNNSTFTTHVVSSTGTDTYSAVAAALCSLKGPRHGGANVKVVEMLEDIKQNVHHWDDDEEICNYLSKILNREAFDKSGLIYGMGHAVYSISDPRAEIFREHVEKLAYQKGLDEEFKFYSKIEKLAPKIISEQRKIYKGVSANIDFYSGFVYRMLNIPLELYTPMFAVARIAGWSAHRIEELVNRGKIIRPAYKGISHRKEYVPMAKRTAPGH